MLRGFLGYMPIAYNRLIEKGLWAEVPAELALEAVKKVSGTEVVFWPTDLRVIDNWDDDQNQIERWNKAGYEVIDITQQNWQVKEVNYADGKRREDVSGQS